jgi:peptide/nickel transport system ATP-binding protein
LALPLLEVNDLRVSLPSAGGPLAALRGLSFTLERGQTLGLIGESGCGKSMTALAVMGLLPDGATVGGRVLLQGQDLTTLEDSALCKLRGHRMGMVFQEPMTALNPVLGVGAQIAEVFSIHGSCSPAEGKERALQMLRKVKIPDAERRYGEYPHQMSGGMKQRVMIAMALAHRPALLVADEPTTALDVTIQAQVLRLLKDLQEELGTAIVFVTHDLAVVAEIADTVVVMYAGRAVEQGRVLEVFERPAHPYTVGLLGARPRRGQTRHTHPVLSMIPGSVPALGDRPPGCSFQGRCARVQAQCRAAVPSLEPLGSAAGATHHVACFHPVPSPAVA